ncbi:murein hydrolase activator EnvC family protein [Commensalibacter papalotli (ex Servin-Garciduenas et al. 2014)]|uniref:Metallopeptidase membrane-bound n=1 Tax=Commensalibacter papalotli (ex Servin-Garciduenas et al. 2014) TaxID=1208583 RepID=W7DZX1_9PROT|nr:peptidoglycan DD-metalloendopeptidase family protein [Commensalibacter papalotli (ex Servin-Garciduenas et al. 2014)]EUK18214.1 metallopeptidase membrane-bound [Commensalibacter papalotli (ex Servin-Garciduenas et al. 2014)]
MEQAKEAQIKLQQQKQQTANQLKNLQQQKADAVKKASEDRKKAEQLNQEMLKASQTLQTTEKKSVLLAEQIEAFKKKIALLDQKLQEESKHFSKFLPVMERLSLYPTDTLLAAPQSSRSTLGLSVIKGISAQLEQKAQLIKKHKTELDELKNKLTEETKKLEALHKEQEQQRNQLAKATEEARAIQKRSASAAFKVSQDAAQAAAKASNINDAIRKITASRQAAENRLRAEALAAERLKNQAKAESARKEIKTITQSNDGPGLSSNSKGAPVAGRVVSLWGSSTDTGPAQGTTYAPQSMASVRAPCNGQIEFASPFRGYGQMVILNCGKNYRFVLAGMGALNVGVGQSISKGVAIGRMPVWSGGGNTGRPTLFVQLRHGERAINPSPFL